MKFVCGMSILVATISIEWSYNKVYVKENKNKKNNSKKNKYGKKF